QAAQHFAAAVGKSRLQCLRDLAAQLQRLPPGWPTEFPLRPLLRVDTIVRPDLVARRQHPPPGRVVAIRHGLTETARRARVHIGETAVCFRPTISSAFGLTPP